MLRRVTVTDVAALKSAADNMLAMQARETERADKARYRGPDEKRRAEGKLTKQEAVDVLVGEPPRRTQRHHCVAVVERAQKYAHLNGSERFQTPHGVYLVSYSDPYWSVRPSPDNP
jgi:hypothetical protein